MKKSPIPYLVIIAVLITGYLLFKIFSIKRGVESAELHLDQRLDSLEQLHEALEKRIDAYDSINNLNYTILEYRDTMKVEVFRPAVDSAL